MTGDLKVGSSGTRVQQLQRGLASIGFDNNEKDGRFGKETEVAVRLFQRVAALPITGVADEKMLQALNEMLSGRLRPSVSDPRLRRSGNDVESIQPRKGASHG
jgi:peptidoglycan hydrolase-like protein with peptidoglycan-binding domain